MKKASRNQPRTSSLRKYIFEKSLGTCKYLTINKVEELLDTEFRAALKESIFLEPGATYFQEEVAKNK